MMHGHGSSTLSVILKALLTLRCFAHKKHLSFKLPDLTEEIA
jgi:hypothetical protein